MAKEEGIKIDGVVTEVLPNAMFRVKMPNNNLVIGYISGKMRQHDIKILLGDTDRKSTRLNSSHIPLSRMPSSA